MSELRFISDPPAEAEALDAYSRAVTSVRAGDAISVEIVPAELSVP